MTGANVRANDAVMWLFGHLVGSWGEAAGGEEHAEPVVLAVAEASGLDRVTLVPRG